MKNADAPAFPSDDAVNPGLSKREWLAGVALQGILASYAGMPNMVLPSDAEASQWAVEYADALLEELEESPQSGQTSTGE